MQPFFADFFYFVQLIIKKKSESVLQLLLKPDFSHVCKIQIVAQNSSRKVNIFYVQFLFLSSQEDNFHWRPKDKVIMQHMLWTNKYTSKYNLKIFT